MTIILAIFLGLVYGLSNILPLSEFAHLAVLQNLFGMPSASGGHVFFTALMQLGSLFTILIMYSTEIKALLSRANTSNMDSRTRAIFKMRNERFLLMLVIASVFLIVPLIYNSSVTSLSTKTVYMGLCLIASGIIALSASNIMLGEKDELNMGILDTIIIGIATAAAVFTGVSRMGTSLTAAYATGLREDFALRFAILLSVPVLFVQVILNFIKAAAVGVNTAYLMPYIIGMLVSMVATAFSILLMRAIAHRGGMKLFSFYCSGAGLLTIVLTLGF